MKEALELFSGPLVCITAPLTSQHSSHEQEHENLVRSRFYMLVPAFSSSTEPRSPQSRLSMVLKEVGPLMLPVDRVEWEGGSSHCAVQYGNRVNILRIDDNLSHTNANHQYQCSTSILRTISSFSVANKPCSLSWLPNSGVLFIATVKDVFMIMTDYPYSLGQSKAVSERPIEQYANDSNSGKVVDGVNKNDCDDDNHEDVDRSSDDVDVGSVNEDGDQEQNDNDNDNNNNRILIKLMDLSQLDTSDNAIDTIHVATTSFTRQGLTNGSRYLYTKPEGPVEIIGIRGGTLVLVNAEGHYSSFPLLRMMSNITSPSGKQQHMQQTQKDDSKQQQQRLEQQQPFNPLLACALGLGLGARGESLVDLINTTVPIHNHDYIAAMLLRRGLVLEALDLKGLNLASRIECIIRHDMKQQAVAMYVSILEAPVPHCPSVVMLMLYLHHHQLLQGGFESTIAIDMLKQHGTSFDESLLAALQSSKMNCKEIKERGVDQGNVALLKSLKLYNLAVGNDDKNTNNIEELKRNATSMAQLACRPDSN